jgi:hypothetical protein
VQDIAPNRSADAPHVLPASLRIAVVVILAQALALVGLAVVVVIKAATGNPHSLAGALLGAVLALVAAAVFGYCARAMLQSRAVSRTPVVVLELVALPVSYSLTFQAHQVGYGAPILVSALAVLYLLFTPASRAILDRER